MAELDPSAATGLTSEDMITIHGEVWPFFEDIALALEPAATSVIKVVVESPLYVPVVKERLRRLGYQESSESVGSFLRVGYPIAHSLSVEVRKVDDV